MSNNQPMGERVKEMTEDYMSAIFSEKGPKYDPGLDDVRLAVYTGMLMAIVEMKKLSAEENASDRLDELWEAISIRAMKLSTKMALGG